jgi:hypothetical protein
MTDVTLDEEMIFMALLPRLPHAILLTSASIFLGCSQAPPPAAPPKPPAAAKAPAAAKVPETAESHGHPHDEGGHAAHGAGPHDGTLADLGGGKYHVEFTVDHDAKETVVYVLGSDEKTAAPVTTADGTLLLTIVEPAFQVTLKARPLPGETGGKSSCYGGSHDNLGIVREFSGTISGEVDGTPYAGEFVELPHGHE